MLLSKAPQFFHERFAFKDTRKLSAFFDFFVVVQPRDIWYGPPLETYLRQITFDFLTEELSALHKFEKHKILWKWRIMRSFTF